MSVGNDTFTTVTETSWLSRLGGSFKGIFIGLILLILGTVLLYWNEGRAVRTGDAIAEAQLEAVEMPGISRVEPAFDGKMVFATGKAETNDELADPVFGVKTKAISLSRRVEYYQWVEETSEETRTKLGGGEEKVTTYSYTKEWVYQPVNSQNFQRSEGHENSVRIQVEDEEQYARNVSFGAYRLPDFLIRSISGEKPLNLSLTAADRERLQRTLISGEAHNFGNAGPDNMIHTQANTLYVGGNPNAPVIGDVRVTFFEVQPAEISILAVARGDTFAQFRASNGQSFSRLSMGGQDMNGMFEDAISDNDAMTLILRAIGIFLCIAGLRMVAAPLRVVADVIPLLGSIVGAGTGLVAALLGVAWSFIVIAIAWIRFRPVLACIFLGIAAVLIVLLYLKGRAGKNAQASR